MKDTIRSFVIICLLASPLLLDARIFARWHTSMGSFTAELYDELVPITALNFRDLANDDFYNNLIFHRVIEGFMIQDGCPQGTGYGGPGYTIQDEFHPDLLHDSAGVLAMARTNAPNSAGSQYYITLAPQPHLDGGYAVFGRIIENLDVVMAIGGVPTDANDRPINPVNIHQLRMLDLHIGAFFPLLEEPVELLPNTAQMFITEAYTDEAELSYHWFLNGEELPDDTFMIERSFNSGNHNLRCTIASSDSISFDAEWNIQVASSNSDSSAPELSNISLECRPNPFSESIEIRCESKLAQKISLQVYNLRGQLVKQILEPEIKQGAWELSWDARDSGGNIVPQGMYLLKMQSPQGKLYRKISKTK
jgi:cyclophilin family peptidyl-prolyl cis-trans isomerase